MRLSVKRAYDAPTTHDGTRVLADRLWPRGVRKTEAQIDIWAKDITPSSDLRRWFHQDPVNRFTEFKKKYRTELTRQKAVAKDLVRANKRITLVTAVKDIEHSHIPTLMAFLKKF